jgi:hypothetical protein
MRTSLLLAFVFLTGCVSYGPLNGAAHDSGVGYSEKRQSATVLLLRYDGRTDQKHSALRPLLLRRASEICNGSFILSDYTNTSGFVMHSKKTIWPAVTAKLECLAPPVHDEVRFDRAEG